jgi:hypothetical protein
MADMSPITNTMMIIGRLTDSEAMMTAEMKVSQLTITCNIKPMPAQSHQ